MVLLDDDLAVFIPDIFAGIAAGNAVLQALNGFVSIHERLDRHPWDDILACSTVLLADDQLLRYIDHSSGQVTRVSRAECRIGKSLAGAVCRHEVFQNVQTFTEIGLDRKFDGVALGIRHQAAHAGQLLDLLVGTAGTGIGHHEDIVVLVHVADHNLGQFFIDLGPGCDNGAVAFLLRQQTSAEILGNLIHRVLALLHQLVLLFRHDDVSNGNSHGRLRRIMISDGLDQVEHFGCLESPVNVDASLQNLLELLLGHHEIDLKLELIARNGAIHVAEILWNDLIEQETAER